MLRLPPRLVLTAAAALVAVCLASGVPVLDEESYLDLARQLDPARPYDWWRAWQPWGEARPPDAYVYAHPPLFLMWLEAWMGEGRALPVRALKAAAALPPAMLLGWSAGRLAERVTRRPLLAGGAWLAAPITVLGLQRGLMPDLLVTALGTFAVVSWLEGQAQGGAVRARWLAFAGAALGLAAFTKYPALVLLLPLALHARAVDGWRAMWAFALAFVLTFGLGEAWLWASYGRPHLLEVLLRAGEIGRGGPLGRGLGLLSRLGLVGVPALPLLLWPWRRDAPVWVVVGGLLALVGAPSGTPVAQVALLAALASVGAALVSVAVLALGRRGRLDDRTPGDGLLLGAWALAVVLGVLLAHNYAAPRYLMPAMLPLALLVARSAEKHFDAALALQVGSAVAGALALAVTVAEHRFHGAQVDAAEAALAEAPEPGRFSGEWAFRWRMEQAGWTWWGGGPLPAGVTVISATQAAPRAIPDGWTEVDHHARGRGTLRVLDAAGGVALYGETIGAVPLGLGDGMLEEAVTWTTR